MLTTSNVVPNSQKQTYPGLLSTAGMSPAYKAAFLSGFSNPATQGSISKPAFTGLVGSSMQKPKSQSLTSQPVDTSGFTPEQLAAFNKAANLGSGVSTTTEGVVGGQSGAGNAKTPEQIAAAHPGATTGIGSPVPSTTPAPASVTPGSLGTGSPSSLAANQSASGLLGNFLGSANTQYNAIRSAIQPTIQANQNIISKATAEEEALTGGSYSGTAADYSGRLAQLENIKQAAQQNINDAEQNILNAYSPVQSGYQTGIGAATQYQQAPYGTPLYNPLTGTYTMAGGQGGTGGALAPETAATNAAQGVMNGSLTYDQALSSLSYLPGGVGQTYLNNAITQAGGNPLQLQASSAAAQSNIGTQQTAQINALASIYGQNAPQAYTLNNALNNIQSLGSLTLQTLQGGSINPLTIQAGNKTIADLRRELSSPAQAAFDSNMANFQSALSAIYAETSGAIPTQVTQWGTQIANGTMPLATLQSVYQQAVTEGDLRLSNLKATTGAAYSGLQSSPTGAPTGGSSGSVSAGGYNFVQNAQGQWIPA